MGRTLLVLVVLALTGLFALLNWSAFAAPTSLYLGFTTVQAPLGIIMLGVVALLAFLIAPGIAFIMRVVSRRLRRLSRELQELMGAGTLERLGIGVGADEFHTTHARGDHVFDGVAAATANTDHLDVGSLVERAVSVVLDHFKSHVTPPLKTG